MRYGVCVIKIKDYFFFNYICWKIGRLMKCIRKNRSVFICICKSIYLSDGYWVIRAKVGGF